MKKNEGRRGVVSHLRTFTAPKVKKVYLNSENFQSRDPRGVSACFKHFDLAQKYTMLKKLHGNEEN